MGLGLLATILPDALKGVSTVIDRLVPDTNLAARVKAEIETAMTKHMAAVDLAQLEVNKTEAQHASIFVAGWRPAVGWICAAGVGYKFILYPIGVFGVALYDPALAAQLPKIEIAELVGLLTGMLGMGGLRSFDKIKGVARNVLNPRKET